MDPVELNERVARLEERMKTMQAEYRTDIARLAEDNAKRDAASAKRETWMLITVSGLIIATATLGFGTLAFLIGLPS